MAKMQEVSRRKTRQPDAVLFGEIVRKLREERGWTQEQLAERAEMNASYLGFVERGDNVPTLTIIIQIAEGLGIVPDELLREVMKRRRR
jgi:transcriptional regulator with XRE-family HTH domain